MNYNELV